MYTEIDLLVNYPKAKRDLTARASAKTQEDIEIARRFDREFFDGERRHGYGGFTYNPRFWQPVVPTFCDHWALTSSSSVLDVGCAKGFMINDFKKIIPGIEVAGIDVSEYAISNAMDPISDCVQVGNANNLPFADKTFDYVISINTIHNLELDECKLALKEITRVARKDAFITVDAYETQEQKDHMYAWNLTAKTILSTSEWKEIFKEVGYTGDYFWFMP
jgi:SAM-dependent methyltransferase